MKSTSTIQVKTSCHHCGDDCQQEVWKKDKVFCCEACSMVYELLQEHDLGHFYALKEANGKASTRMAPNAYAYLDHEEIAEQLLDFQDEQMAKLRFHLPDIHCAACIWLLEKLYKFDEGILQSRVHFLRKEIRLSFQPSKTSIRKIAELLARLGYPPKLKLDDLEASQPKATSQGLQLQLGIAGFVFGNIMLLSFPEYLGLDSLSESNFQHFFGYVNLLLAIPLVAYSGIDYLKSAWFALRQKNLNIDVPISLGIMTLLLRSGYDIISHSGPGYLDVLAGLIFFLLIGKWFQQKTYYHLSFERDFKAYFPISASLPDGRQLPVNALTAGDRILIRHGELIPADSLLKKGKAQIDYSFVTGEAIPLGKAIGDKLYAGGRQMGAAIEVEVLRKVSQSYLTQLWNEQAYLQEHRAGKSLSDLTGKYFTILVLCIAFSTLFYWLPIDSARAINAFTAVLIITCPCAIALSIPFTYGNAIRLLARMGIYLKHTEVLDDLAKINCLVFDKTGTLTMRSNPNALSFSGEELSDREKALIGSLASQSMHPLSQMIAQQVPPANINCSIHEFEEIKGKGIQAWVDRHYIRMGSAAFLGQPQAIAGVTIEIDGQIKGYFHWQAAFRDSLPDLFDQLSDQYDLHLISGDHQVDQPQLRKWFDEQQMHFRQQPEDKLQFIQDRQQAGQKVMMIGDGLNDAGALKQSHVGLVIAEQSNNFTPASDIIMEASQMGQLAHLLQYARDCVRLIWMAYGLAALYNIIGLSFAVQAELSPIIAAILMPLSSVSIVLFGVLSSSWKARQFKIEQSQKPL